MSNAVETESLTYCWPGNDHPVINIPNWRVTAGERVFIYGPSGCGKSTLLNLLAGILVPQGGGLRVCGQDMGQLGGRARDRFRASHIGMIYQQFNLIPYLSIADNIALAQHFGGIAGHRDRGNNSFEPGGSDEDQQEMARLETEGCKTENFAPERLMERLDLPVQLLRCKAGELSVGQQQRVAVVRALINRPQLIIADEPSSALDNDARDDFLTLLLDCAAENQSTVVFVSHDRSIARKFDSAVDMLMLNAALHVDSRGKARRHTGANIGRGRHAD